MSDWKVTVEPDGGGCGSFIGAVVLIIILIIIVNSCSG